MPVNDPAISLTGLCGTARTAVASLRMFVMVPAALAAESVHTT